MSTKLELKARAALVKNAQEKGENTALRVGGLLEDMVDYVGEAGAYKDKEYDPIHNSGLGRKTLELNNGSNILTLGQFNQDHTIYVISYDFNLDGGSITIPLNCILEFAGGSISNGTIVGNGTDITANDSDVIFKNGIIISGTWNVANIHDEWFEYTENMVSNQLIKNILALTNDNVDNNVYITRNTTYHVEFTPPEDLCEEHPYYTTDGRISDSDHEYADGSDTDRAKLIWTEAGTTKSITRHVGSYKYTDPNNIYQKLGGTFGGLWLDSDVVDGITIFYIKSNTSLIIDSTIQLLNHKQTCYYMFNMRGKENISISGKGKLLGEITTNYSISNKWPVGSQNYETYWMYYGEWGYIIWMSGAKNVSIKGLTIGGASGDGIYFNPDCTPCVTGGAPNITKNVVIEDVIIDTVRRNGISCCGHNVLIHNVEFRNCGIDVLDEINPKGTPPKCGIDFESDFLNPMWVNNDQFLYNIANTFFNGDINQLGCKKVLMDNCKFVNNTYDMSTATSQYNDNSKELGAVTISNCNFTSPLRINATNCMRFRNCHIETITSYDDTTDPESWSTCMEYEDCSFGDELASRYFAYTNRTIGSKHPIIKLSGCTGRTLYTGGETIYYSNIADSVVEVRVPFDYDSRLGAFPYKINRGIMHIKIAQVGALSLRVTECDLFMSEFPRIYNKRYHGGEYLSAENNSNFVGICSEPQIVTDNVNHVQYISFYIASGDVLNRYYDYDTKQWSTTPSGDRPYQDKDIIIGFDYIGVPDNRGNIIRSVRTGNWRIGLRGGVNSGTTIMCGRVNPEDFAQIDGYEFSYNDWTEDSKLSAITNPGGSNEYIWRFPRLLVGGIPNNDINVVEKDVYGGLYTDQSVVNFNTFHSSRFGVAMINQGNIPAKLDTSYVALRKAMTKAELASKVLVSYDVKFESGQQVFITDEGTNGMMCTLLYDETKISNTLQFAGNTGDTLITVNDTLEMYVLGKLIKITVSAGETILTVISRLRQAIITAFATELVSDITAPLDPSDPNYEIKNTTGRIEIKNDNPNSTVIYMRYANSNGVYAYSAGIYIVHSLNALSNFIVTSRLDAGEDFKVVDSTGNLVTKFW